jgi:hypothetical protein
VHVYSERLDISMANAAAMEKIVHRLRCKDLERAIRKELYTMRSVAGHQDASLDPLLL